jgi:hypothetical protein
MSPVADLSAVAAAGREIGAMYRAHLSNPNGAADALPYLVGRLDADLGHAGSFDYQRKGNLLTGYTQLRQFRDVSNFNVGLYCQQAGMTLNDTLSAAGRFANLFSSNARPDEPHGLDPKTAQFIIAGFNVGQSGVFGQPIAP